MHRASRSTHRLLINLLVDVVHMYSAFVKRERYIRIAITENKKSATRYSSFRKKTATCVRNPVSLMENFSFSQKRGMIFNLVILNTVIRFFF